MKVLFITGEYPPMRGGIADHVAGLRQALECIDVSSSVLTSTSANDPSHGNEVLPIISGWSFLSWPLIVKTVKRTEADLVHLQYQTGAFGLSPAVNLLPLWLRLVSGIPVITTMHDLREPYIFPKAGLLRRWANLVLIRASTAVVATNPEDYNALIQMASSILWPFASTKIYPIPLGNNLRPVSTGGADRTIWRTRVGLDEDSLTLSYFGMLNWSKGVDTLFKSLRLLLDSGVACRLMMLGEGVGSSDRTNQSYKDAVISLALELGIEDKIIWTGYLSPDELSHAFHASDICVLPFEDGSSLRRTSLLAALSYGVPMITTTPVVSQSKMRDLSAVFPSIVDGDNCLMVPVRSPEAIAEAVRRLLADPQLRHRLGLSGREMAEKLSMENMAEQTADMYSQTLAVRKEALAHE